MFYPVLRRHIFLLLILLSFFIYTVSPLSFTITEEAIAGITPTVPPCSSTEEDIHILLLDYLCSQLISAKETESDTLQVKILLRKKRAVISKNIIPKLLSLKSISSVDTSFTPAYNSLYAIPAYGVRHKRQIESYHRYTDLSPPRFSKCPDVL